MSDPIDLTDRTTRIAPAAPLEGRRRERSPVEDAPVSAQEAASFDGIPASPPDDVLAEVDAAMAHLEALRAAGASVSFETGASGLRIELVGENGTRREIGAAELFDVASGRAPDPADPAEDPARDGAAAHVDREA
ncbi:unannotated protein [freshwater metagenome]|uniref:Unannotated protein n=1 Tax=freshwater metagenome TaxID=449393 RepID=A0A6J7IMW6_9ZZZZ|nr:hypothetical protein [Actinomycetota bacterium]